MIKRIISAITAIAFLIVLSVGVSADSHYITLDDYGYGCCIKYNTTPVKYKSLNYISDTAVPFILGGNPDYDSLFFYWAFSIKPDYTYTCIMSFTAASLPSPSAAPTISKASSVYVHNTKIPTSSTNYLENAFDNILYTLTYEKNTDNTYTINVTVSFNPSSCGINATDIYVYAPASAKDGTYSLNGWGTYASYDPNGSYYDDLYSDYLKDISNQLHKGDEYTPPTSAATDLNDSLTSFDSAEGVVKDKSSSLINSVSSEMSDNLSQAKALSTTLKPAAVQINNIYNSFLSVLPAEVKAVFIAVPLLLFVGWLVGRIKE